MSKGKVVFTVLFIGLSVIALVISCGGGEEPTQVPTPSRTPTETAPTEAPSPTSPSTASGAELLRERCTACHTLDRVQRASKTEAEWEATVERMRGKWDELTAQEAQTLIEYLVENYGP